MRLILAYPPDHLPPPVHGGNDVVTVDENPDHDWPHPLSGPSWRDPIKVYRFLCQNVKPGDVLIPLCEEVVLPVSAAIRETGCGGFPHSWRCVNRAGLRQLLPADLNPTPWAIDTYLPGPMVMKAPASTGGRGVCVNPPSVEYMHQKVLDLMDGNPMVDQLQAFHGLDYSCVFERLIPPPQYEISGVCGPSGEILHMGPVLLQVWEGPEIVRYELLGTMEGLPAAAERATQALGMQDCAWCIEFRRASGGWWKVIDAHCRVGDEVPGKWYYENMPGFMDHLVQGLLRADRPQIVVTGERKYGS